MDSQGEKYTHRAINSHGNIAPLDESHDMPQESHSDALVPGRKAEATRETEVDPNPEIQRQWQWSVAEEMLPTADYDRSSKILEEVGRMEVWRSEEHTSELQSHSDLVCRLLLEKK